RVNWPVRGRRPQAMPEQRDEPGRGFWVALVVGGGLIGWGVVLLFGATPDLDRRINFATWVVGLNLAHDLVAIPAVLGVGAVVARLVRGNWRAPLQAALLTTGVVLLVAAPPLFRTADVSGNPTVQPLDYRRGTLTVLAVVWASALAWGALRRMRRG
ncbi:MAG: hypothetical protein ACRDV9_03215, partial [Acidimicrobiia bacterium]